MSEENILKKGINISLFPKELAETLGEGICQNSKEQIISDKLVFNHPQNSSRKYIEENDYIDKVGDEKLDQTILKETNENETLEKNSLNKSRELKSILALSKEAKLDTNLPAKRKENNRKRDFAKLHNVGLSGKNLKSSLENKSFKFPVTAEAELEEESFDKCCTDIPKDVKRARTSSRDCLTSGPSEDILRRNRKIDPGDIHILKVNKVKNNYTNFNLTIFVCICY